MKKSKKYYTISTYMFSSLKEAQEQIQEWVDEGTLNEDSRVFEINGEYDIKTGKVELVKVK